ncbi:MAG TPA: hypothetical protein VN678_11855 [Acidobacteriaceae bacterium]|nr:hypothetical protein [Acidobacteriaceae bacterium]
MDRRTWKAAQVGAFAVLMVASASGAAAQTTRAAGTLTIAGQPEQAQLLRMNGKSYVDVESLARVTHGTLRFEGTRTILTLPVAGASATGVGEPTAAVDTTKVPRLTEEFLGAEIEALTQVREWHVSLVNAVNYNYPITTTWVSPMQRQAEAKLQLALAAATSGPDRQASQLLQAEFANMQQISDQLLALHDKASYISPEIFNNNTLDAKILGCEQALASMAATKQFQDEVQCH